MLPEFFEYPGTQLHNSNMDWLLMAYKKLLADYEELIRWKNEEAHDFQEVLQKTQQLEQACINLNHRISEQYSQITGEYMQLVASVQLDLIHLITETAEQLREYTDNAVHDIPGYYMRSPVTGQIEDLPTVIMELFDTYRQGLTASEYDALDLTASAYDALQITAYDYDMLGIQ